MSASKLSEVASWFEKNIRTKKAKQQPEEEAVDEILEEKPSKAKKTEKAFNKKLNMAKDE